MHLRTTEEAEILGIDEDQCGEAGYDYAFTNRDIENPHRLVDPSNRHRVILIADDSNSYKEWQDQKALAASTTGSSRGESEKSSPSNLHKTASGEQTASSEVQAVRETV